MRNPRRRGEFHALPCYHNPTNLFGSMDNLARSKVFNFIWVGIVTTQYKMTETEMKAADAVLKEKNCYAVYF